ncbi:MAG TPA: BCCT family transporter [Acetomicrobium flavidum]|uniref:BCCT family transporter n=1 Tax=Acetomicrobium flavidum TaxID=49896 RepID=UPI002C41DFB2|nr:BCCT family transporter [Acetomicrobium flavidum]
MSAKEKKDNSVYVISMVIMLLAVGWGFLSPASFGAAANNLFNFLIQNFGWGYMLFMTFFVIFPIGLAISKYGKLKLGPADSKPEFRDISWFAMLFSAGMGVGLVFYGVGEPLFHFLNPPFGAEPGSVKAATDAMRISFFHWGLHPWAGYTVIALPLAYFQFRKNGSGLISTLFTPLLGEEGVRGPIGKAIDILAIFATAAGIATSLGLGTLQINSGLKYLFGVPQTVTVQFMIIFVLCLIYTGSAISGLEKGIKAISDLNLFLATLLCVALFILGPTISILDSLLTGIGEYLSNLVSESLTLAPYGGPFKKWLGSWTLFYWAWWIAWAPFVGSFIARISRGRTVRQFVTCVLIVPALGSFTWFAVFGTSGLYLQLNGIADIASKVSADISTGVFEMYMHYPLGMAMSVVMVVLISTFFITSANSATFVLSMYSTQGDLNPPKSKMAIWGVLQAALAFVLLMSGGLQALQIASIAAAAPFAVIMALACYSLIKALKSDEEVSREINN